MPRIRINPNNCHGKPAIQDTGIMVSQVLGALAAGDAKDGLLQDYPNIGCEDLIAAPEFGRKLTGFENHFYNTSVS